MKNRTLFSALLLLSIVGCEKAPVPKDIPECIRERIEAIKKAPVQNPPATVYSYQYKGQTVYGIPEGCCDQYNEVYDETCQVVCAPSGGLGGAGYGCPDFSQQATQQTLIWQDSRKRN